MTKLFREEPSLLAKLDNYDEKYCVFSGVYLKSLTVNQTSK